MPDSQQLPELPQHVLDAMIPTYPPEVIAFRAAATQQLAELTTKVEAEEAKQNAEPCCDGIDYPRWPAGATEPVETEHDPDCDNRPISAIPATDPLDLGGEWHTTGHTPCPTGRPYTHRRTAECDPASPPDFQLPTVDRLRAALAAAETERDELGAIGDALTTDLGNIRRERDRALAERDELQVGEKAYREKILDLDQRLRQTARERDDARREADDYQRLFDLQYTRTTEAEKRWRAQDPTTRSHIAPDLGALLDWLMTQADKAGRERDSLARRCALRFEQKTKAEAERDQARAQTLTAYEFAGEMSADPQHRGFALALRDRLDEHTMRANLTEAGRKELDAHNARGRADSVSRDAQESSTGESHQTVADEVKEGRSDETLTIVSHITDIINTDQLPAETRGSVTPVEPFAGADGVKILLAAINHALTTGSHMTNANLALLELLDQLGINEADLPPFDPEWANVASGGPLRTGHIVGEGIDCGCTFCRHLRGEVTR